MCASVAEALEALEEAAYAALELCLRPELGNLPFHAGETVGKDIGGDERDRGLAELRESVVDAGERAGRFAEGFLETPDAPFLDEELQHDLLERPVMFRVHAELQAGDAAEAAKADVGMRYLLGKPDGNGKPCRRHALHRVERAERIIEIERVRHQGAFARRRHSGAPVWNPAIGDHPDFSLQATRKKTVGLVEMLLRLQEARTAGDEAMTEYGVLVERVGEDFGAPREEDVERFIRQSARDHIDIDAFAVGDQRHHFIV